MSKIISAQHTPLADDIAPVKIKVQLMQTILFFKPTAFETIT